MHKQLSKTLAYLFPAFLCLAMLTGCARDPKTRSERFLHSGQDYFDAGKFDAARIQFARAVQADPQSARAHYQLGRAFLKLQLWPDGYRELEKAVGLDAKYVPAHLELADLQLAGGQIAKARQEAGAALAVEPNNLAAHLLLGRIALADKDYNQALEEFSLGQDIAPKDPVPFAQAGDAYLLQQRYANAIRSFERAIELDASFSPAYLDMAQIYRAQGDYASELRVLQEAIAHNPKQIPAYLLEAAACVRLGHSDQVGDLFKQLRSATSDAPESLLAIGNFYFEIGDALQAKTALTLALAGNPYNKAVRSRLVEVALSQQDWDEAEKLNSGLLKADPKDPTGRLFQARLQYVRGAKAEAIGSLERLVHDVPEMPLPHFYLGLAYAGQGQTSRAIAALNDSLQHGPDFIWAYVSLGNLYLAQGSPKLALGFASQALARNRNFIPALLLQADAYMQLSNYGAAVTVLQELAAGQPRNPVVMEKLAVAAIKQRQFPQAEQRLEQALEFQPDYVLAIAELVQLYGLEGHADKSIARIQQQIERAPKQSGLLEILGDVYLSKGDTKNSELAFENALKLQPSATVARIQLARVYAAESRLPEAIQNAQIATQDHPDSLGAYALLASLYQQSGAIEQAEKVYQLVLDKNGDYAPALNNLAWLYCENGGNLDMALSLAQRAKANLPAEPSVSDTLAWIEYHKGLYGTAATALGDLTHQMPGNATYQYHLGMTLWKMGRSVPAKTALQRALDLHLNDNAAREARSALSQLNSRSS